MSIQDKLYVIHFILNNKIILKQYNEHCPVIGDEIRIGGKNNEKFYKVICRIWVYDEPDCPHQRINIGLEKIKQ